MRKFIKESLLGVVKTLYEAHDSVKSLINKKEYDNVLSLLGECQDTAVQIGGAVEDSEGEGFSAVHELEEYCEVLYQVSVEINDGISGDKAKKMLDKSLIKAENSIKSDIPIRLEILFLPYKASMWDSLESVWKAADEDPDCDAYVVPIPYYEVNPDSTLGMRHYDGQFFPDYVPVYNCDDYDLEKRRPDIIYIHNIYDDYNKVTTVDPRYYTRELKKYTDRLVYIPYYATTGTLDPIHVQLMKISNIDNIVIQTPKYSAFFVDDFPKERLVYTGSPKFDHIINMCKNVPMPPHEWKAKMSGRKVYLFNTSIGGMIYNPVAFLTKMLYVFNTFKNRKDVCLLWRPHPLFESTLRSMRPAYVSDFEKLKRYFIQNEIGIYDETTDIAPSIAMSDVYIGDSGTSVTTLFGVVGKPMFILDNNIHSLPESNNERTAFQLSNFFFLHNGKWYITPGDDLYYSENGIFDYKFVCKLSDYSIGYNYISVECIGNKNFICPINNDCILEVDRNGVIASYRLENINKNGAFFNSIKCGKYIFLIPCNCKCVVRFDSETGDIRYIKDYADKITDYLYDGIVVGGFCVHKGFLYIGSPHDNSILVVNPDNCHVKCVTIDKKHTGGSMTMASDGNRIWITPFRGCYIVSWDPFTGKTQFHASMPEGFTCIMPVTAFECTEEPFSAMVFDDENVYLSACWANMCVKLNKATGQIVKYDVPIDVGKLYKKGYYLSPISSIFYKFDDVYYFFSCYERRMFRMDIQTGSFEEVHIHFDREDLLEAEQGFGRISGYIRYACMENAYNTLEYFLNDNITGGQFNKEDQIAAYSEIAENLDGTCGEKTHYIIKDKLLK